MSETVRTLLARLGSYVPGYLGYAEREARRDTDQALRLSVTAILSVSRAAVDRRIAECARLQRFEDLEPLESLARRLERLADRVRHAPAGYVGLFDAAPMGPTELDRLHACDLEAREACEHLAAAIDALPAAGDEPALERTYGLLAEVESTLRRRGELLAGVR